MISLTIDHLEVGCKEGSTVLQAAQSAGFSIPTLCHHPALEPSGGCRLCTVQVRRGSGDSRWQMAVSCLLPAEPGMEILTQSDELRELRTTLLELLLARCPGSPYVRALARKHGVTSVALEPVPHPTECTLCGLCTRTCDALGLSAISLVDRGITKKVDTPLRQAPRDCVGCLSCARLCPTQCIPYRVSDSHVEIWNRSFELLRCAECGASLVTREQAALLQQRGVVSPEDLSLCESCKRRRTATSLAAIASIRSLL